MRGLVGYIGGVDIDEALGNMGHWFETILQPGSFKGK
jgi:hypothetical protein